MKTKFNKIEEDLQIGWNIIVEFLQEVINELTVELQEDEENIEEYVPKKATDDDINDVVTWLYNDIQKTQEITRNLYIADNLY